MTPRLGILDFNPIQYHTPLYQLISKRARVDLDVLFLTTRGSSPALDEGFGLRVAWDIDLLSGYRHQFLRTSQKFGGGFLRVRALTGWISRHDVIVIHGYANPWMLMAVAICSVLRTPFLLRGDSQPEGPSRGMRRLARRMVVQVVVRQAAGALSIGRQNDSFYRLHGARQIFFAPYSVDNDRFAVPPSTGREQILRRWNLDSDALLIVFCGKLIQRKRPLDLTAAIRLVDRPLNVLYVGDGALADQVRSSLPSRRGAVTGFVNQMELPAYLHAADILVLPSETEPWGLVVNEAMAAGTLPVVADHVGSGPDLVDGIGEIYRCGDVAGLAAALRRAIKKLSDPSTRETVKRHVARYSLEHTAHGFEQAALGVHTLDTHGSPAQDLTPSAHVRQS